MTIREDDSEPIRKPATHRIGEALDDCSVEELGARIATLRAEIVRLEAARDRKQAAMAQAGSIFKI